jgi:hypothetical protein
MLAINAVSSKYANSITTKALYNKTTVLFFEGLSRILKLKVSQPMNFIFVGLSRIIAFLSHLSPQHFVSGFVHVFGRSMFIFN